MDENAMSNILGALINKDNNGEWGNGSGIWVIFFLFMLMMFWGGNWGNRNQTTPQQNIATQADVFGATAFQNQSDAIRETNQGITNLGYNVLTQSNTVNQNVSQQGFDIQSAICKGNNNLQMAVLGAGNNLQQAINAQSNSIIQGITNTGNNLMMGMVTGNNNILETINNNRFEMSRNTCEIRENSTANTQKILDKLCALEADAQAQRINELQTQNQALQLQINNSNQTQNIIGAIRPYPIPSYTVSSPYGIVTTGVALS